MLTLPKFFNLTELWRAKNYYPLLVELVIVLLIVVLIPPVAAPMEAAVAAVRALPTTVHQHHEQHEASSLKIGFFLFLDQQGQGAQWED